MEAVAVNFTMPVFNRLTCTQKALLALAKSERSLPFCITVVDNGSEPPVTDMLRGLQETGIIDKLFLLPRNMGIACACNIGWEMTPADVYCKIDNDTMPLRRDWISALFRLWRHGRPLSTLGYAPTREALLHNPGALHTPDGILGVCTRNLGGTAMFIPKAVSDLLGMWNEEYGLYGAEDCDYGLRMQCAGFPQYYYLAEDFIDYTLDEGDSEAQYATHALDKKAQVHQTLTDAKGFNGRLEINQLLMHLCIRAPVVCRRYAVADIDSHGKVYLRERAEYKAYDAAMNECARLLRAGVRRLGEGFICQPELHERLKGILRGCGCDMETFSRSLPVENTAACR